MSSNASPSSQPDSGRGMIKVSASRRSLQEQMAISYMLTNLCGCPGLGTWLAGQRVLGAIQIVIAYAGMIASIWGCYTVFSYVFTHGLELGFRTPGFGMALLGIGVFFLVTAWAVFSGYMHWQRVKKTGS